MRRIGAFPDHWSSRWLAFSVKYRCAAAAVDCRRLLRRLHDFRPLFDERPLERIAIAVPSAESITEPSICRTPIGCPVFPPPAAYLRICATATSFARSY